MDHCEREVCRWSLNCVHPPAIHRRRSQDAKIRACGIDYPGFEPACGPRRRWPGDSSDWSFCIQRPRRVTKTPGPECSSPPIAGWIRPINYPQHKWTGKSFVRRHPHRLKCFVFSTYVSLVFSYQPMVRLVATFRYLWHWRQSWRRQTVSYSMLNWALREEPCQFCLTK